jgi:sarcosine oxidase, subunit beta
MSNTVHAYISQSDKGELVIGAGTDAYTSYSQTGGLHITEHTLDAICELFPTSGACACCATGAASST